MYILEARVDQQENLVIFFAVYGFDETDDASNFADVLNAAMARNFEGQGVPFVHEAHNWEDEENE